MLIIFYLKPSHIITTGGSGENLDRDSDIMRLNEEMSAWEKIGRMNSFKFSHAVDTITLDITNICP